MLKILTDNLFATTGLQEVLVEQTSLRAQMNEIEKELVTPLFPHLIVQEGEDGSFVIKDDDLIIFAVENMDPKYKRDDNQNRYLVTKHIGFHNVAGWCAICDQSDLVEIAGSCVDTYKNIKDISAARIASEQGLDVQEIA